MMHKDIYPREPEYLENNSSYWADPDDLKRAPSIRQINVTDKFCKAAGLPIISDGYTTYVDNSDTHTLIFGSTGSKKTRLFAMPLINIFALGGESFVTADPKGELFKKTSGFVADKGHKIIVLNFRDMTKSSAWNPLLIPYQLYHEGNVEEAVSMIIDFLTVLAAPQRNATKDVYFIELGFALVLSYLLFFIETATKDEVTISSFLNFFSTFSSPENAKKLVEYLPEGSVANNNLKGVLTTVSAEKTFGNIASTAFAMFNQFVTQKSLCQLLSDSSFDLRSVGREKTAIYLIVPDEKDGLHFLVSIFVKQIYETLIQEAQKQTSNTLPIRLNFLLDEFGNIPTIPNMPSMITAARSRNIRFFLMTQGLFQLNKKYENEVETFVGNCDNLVFLSSKELALLKYFSSLCGEVIEQSQNGIIITYPLISPSGLQRLKKEDDKSDVLILHGRHHPYVSVLPDIDWYGFESKEPIGLKTNILKTKQMYDANKTFNDIDSKKRPMPFSIEVFGKNVYYDKVKKKHDLFDW